MKGTIAILGCLLAAYAAPLFANEVPLILEETIQLPVVPEAWDIMQSADSGFVWCAVNSQELEHKLLWTSCSEDSAVFDELDQYDDEERAFLCIYNREGIGPCVGLGMQSTGGEPITEMLEIACDRSIQDTFFYCRWQGGLCQVGPAPGLRIFCYPELTLVSPIPPSPSETQVLHWYVNEMECVRDIIGGQYYTTCGDYLHLSIPDDEWVCLTEKINVGRANCTYDGNDVRILGYYSSYSISYGMEHSESHWLGLAQYTGDSLFSSMFIRGEPRALACSRDNFLGQGVLIAAFSSGIVAWHQEFYPDTFWSGSQSYDALFSANLAWTENEEILGFDRSRSLFDIYDLLGGSIWGQTSPLDSGYAEMKIIGRYHNESRRLVVRYGSELRIYRFGEPILDADDARPELPNELTLSAYPNPFNPTTMIAFDLPKGSRASLVVYDLNGRLVQTLLDEQVSGGHYEFGFDGAALPSGIYFARLSAGDLVRTQKMVLLK